MSACVGRSAKRAIHEVKPTRAVPVAPSRDWVESLRATLPEPPRGTVVTHVDVVVRVRKARG